MSEFAKSLVKSHNEFRAKHGIDPLVLDSSLTRFAQEWAEHMAKEGKLSHRADRKLNGVMTGENVYYGSGFTPTGKDVSEYWYSEVKKFDWSTYNIQGRGHFSQLIWKASKKIGVGMVAKGKEIYVVCNYEPAGNMLGDERQNIMPPK